MSDSGSATLAKKFGLVASSICAPMRNVPPGISTKTIPVWAVISIEPSEARCSGTGIARGSDVPSHALRRS